MPEGAAARVSVRCRPLTSNEKNNGATRIVKISGDKVVLHNPVSSGSTKEQSFAFENCYFWESKNEELYKDVAEPLLKKVLDGYNATIVSYGQTGSGRSFTLNGSMEEAGLISMVSQTLFSVIEDASNIKDYFVVISYLEVAENYVHDLVNPSGRDLKVRQHPQLGMYVDDIAEVVVCTSDDIVRLCDQGDRIRKLTVTDPTESNKSSSIFNITIEQKAKNNPHGKALRSTISFVDLAASDHTSKSEDAPYVTGSLNSLSKVVANLNQDNKGSSIPYRDSHLTRLLQESFGGNGYTAFIAHISPADSDYSETSATLRFAMSVKNVQNVPKRNENDGAIVIKELRDEISKLREKLAANGSNMMDMPNADDVIRMEDLIKDLQLAKMQTWSEKQRISDMFLEERRHHLSSKGILDWVLDSMKRERRGVQAKLTTLQKDKESYMIEYKEKRKVVDGLKDKLQEMIAEYSQLTEAGKGNDDEGKQKVSEIHEMKEKLKQENELLKKIKQSLKDVQEKQKQEKEEAKSQTATLKGNMELRFKLESEYREKMEKDNQATLADEIDRIKLETEQEKAELKIKKNEAKPISVDAMIKVEIEMLDLKAEKSAMAIKLRSLEGEKKQAEKDLQELFKRQKEEMEIQQLQHFQTFRHYREAFEEQKAALEQRYRALLEDSIQDAVYLSSRNQELVDENQNLKQELAELKDKISMGGERPFSPES